MSDALNQGFQNLQNAIWAVDRLNSWVRSESYRSTMGNNCRRAIYYLKRSALKQVITLQIPANHRLVKSVVKCRDCEGTGRYTDQYGFKHPHCYACFSSGQAKLEFVETELPGLVRWHTPRREWYAVRSALPNEEAIPTDWQPNQAGKNLTIIEVAEAWNTAETFFTDRPPIYSCQWGSGWAYDFDYSFYIGEVDMRRCSLCNAATPQARRHGCHRNLFTWTDNGCDECSKKYERTWSMNAPVNHVSIFDAFPFPQYLAQDPAICRWWERHQGEHLKLETYKAQRHAWASA